MNFLKLSIYLTMAAVSSVYGTECPESPESPESPAISVSLVRLLSAPENYAGKKIQLKGVLATESSVEMASIYLSPTDRMYEVTDNAIFIHIPLSYAKRVSAIDGRYALIEGVFDVADRGPWSLYGGSLSCVSRLEALPLVRNSSTTESKG